MRSILLCAALVLAAASPAGAALRETTYDVTFEAEKVERWQFDEHASSDCDGGRCVRDAVGSGSTRVFLKTPRPQRVSVTTGIPRMQPMVVASIDRGIALKGSHRVGGTFTDVYGGPWKAANQDFVAPTEGCGNHTVTTDVALAWTGRNQLAPVLSFDDLRACPTGPVRGFDYDGTPVVGEVVAQVAETKFGRTKQFTVRGSRTWAGTTPTLDLHSPESSLTSRGQSEVRWSWSATFRMVKRKKRR